MTIAEIMKRMIGYSQGNLHDISHFLKVWAYAKTMGELEKLDGRTQFILETAAIVHDIACPLCREKFGNTNGKHQEAEGMVLAAEFLKDTDLPEDVRDRVVYLVGHHHTFSDISGMDYQLLIEADYLVNAEESQYPAENIRNFMEHICRTETGRSLLQSVYRP